MPTPAELAQSERIRTLFIRDCMRRYGSHVMDASATGPAASAALFDPLNMTRRYGVGDMATARRYGYRAAPGQPGGPKLRGRAPARPLSAYTPDQRLLLTGAGGTARPTTSPERPRYRGQPVPESGCYGEADRALRNSGSRASAFGGVVSVVEHTAYTRSVADPRVQAVFAKWSACMKERGHPYPDPLAAAGDTARWKPDTGPAPQPAEIATAKADMSCKQQTNLIGTWFAVESEYQNTEISRHAKELADVKRQLTAETRTRATLAVRYGPEATD